MDNNGYDPNLQAGYTPPTYDPNAAVPPVYDPNKTPGYAPPTYDPNAAGGYTVQPPAYTPPPAPGYDPNAYNAGGYSAGGYNQYATYNNDTYPGKNKGIAALTLGIVSIVSGWIPGWSYFVLPCAIVGLVLAIQARKVAPLDKRSIATGGLITSIVGLAISLITALCVVAVCFATVADSSYYY